MTEHDYKVVCHLYAVLKHSIDNKHYADVKHSEEFLDDMLRSVTKRKLKYEVVMKAQRLMEVSE